MTKVKVEEYKMTCVNERQEAGFLNLPRNGFEKNINTTRKGVPTGEFLITWDALSLSSSDKV